MIFANCHFHSTFSDGDYTPEQLVEIAKKAGYGGLILTDHDTLRGCYFLQKAARKAGILSLIGCEFSTRYKGKSFHLVGVDFNPENKALKELIAYGSNKQWKRTELLFQWGQERGTLRKGITWQDVVNANPDHDYLCRNQVIRLMQEKGIYFEEEWEPIDPNFSYKDKEREARVKELTGIPAPQLEDAVRIIREAGGVPIVAHPMGMIPYAEELLAMGVMGFEISHPDCEQEELAFFARFCEQNGLYKSGGTDHSSLLSAADDGLPIECGGIGEEDFMKLYRRELG